MKTTTLVLTLFIFINSFAADSLSSRKELIYRCLDMEKEAGFDVKEKSYLLLDTLLLKAGKRININDTLAKNYPENILKEIHSIMEEAGIEGDYNQNNPYKSLLSYSLQSKKFDCDKYSFVFLAVAERLNLPLYGVLLPSHMAIEWKDSSRSFYWETTDQSKRTKEEYIKQFAIQKYHQNQGMYLTPMSEEDLRLCFLYNRGLTFLMLRKYQLAQRDIEASANLKGIHPFIHYMKELCIHRTTIDKSTLRLLQDPDNDSARIERAKAYIQLRGVSNFQKALSDLNYVILMDPAHKNAHLWRGVSYMQLFMLGKLNNRHRNYKKALEDFNFVFAIDSNDYEVRFYKSILNRWARNYEEAIADIEIAISLQATEEAWLEKGNIFYNQKEFEKAIECYHKALEINPQYFKAIQCRGFAKLELEKKEDALEDFFQAYYQGIMPYSYFKKYSELRASYINQ